LQTLLHIATPEPARCCSGLGHAIHQTEGCL